MFTGEARSLPHSARRSEGCATGPRTSNSGVSLSTRDDVIARLEAGVRELTTSEGWLRWLSVQSKFWRYSPANALLIAWQRPDASLVAGYQRWRGFDRQVRKGETGIRILAPCRYRVPDDDGDDSGNGAEVVRGFRIAVVFAVEQTDGAAIPRLPTTTGCLRRS